MIHRDLPVLCGPVCHHPDPKECFCIELEHILLRMKSRLRKQEKWCYGPEVKIFRWHLLLLPPKPDALLLLLLLLRSLSLSLAVCNSCLNHKQHLISIGIAFASPASKKQLQFLGLAIHDPHTQDLVRNECKQDGGTNTPRDLMQEGSTFVRELECCRKRKKREGGREREREREQRLHNCALDQKSFFFKFRPL